MASLLSNSDIAAMPITPVVLWTAELSAVVQSLWSLPVICTAAILAPDHAAGVAIPAVIVIRTPALALAPVLALAQGADTHQRAATTAMKLATLPVTALRSPCASNAVCPATLPVNALPLLLPSMLQLLFHLPVLLLLKSAEDLVLILPDALAR